MYLFSWKYAFFSEHSTLCVVLRIRMLKSFLTLCINSGQGCICIIFHEPFVQNSKNSGKHLSSPGYERLQHQKELLANNIRTLPLFISNSNDLAEELISGHLFNIYTISDFWTSRLHPSHGLIITGIFLSPSPNVVFISCSCFGGNNSLTRDIMLDTSQRLYQLSRKPSPNWCNSFSCFSRRRTWNWKNVSQWIKLG